MSTTAKYGLVHTAGMKVRRARPSWSMGRLLYPCYDNCWRSWKRRRTPPSDDHRAANVTSRDPSLEVGRKRLWLIDDRDADTARLDRNKLVALATRLLILDHRGRGG